MFLSPSPRRDIDPSGRRDGVNGVQQEVRTTWPIWAGRRRPRKTVGKLQRKIDSLEGLLGDQRLRDLRAPAG